MFNLFSLYFRRYRRRWFYPLLSLFIALGITVGSPLSSPAIPWADLILQGVQVIQLSNISNKQEVQLGKQINQELVSSKVRIYRNQDVNRYVDAIGQQLAASSDRPDIPYTFQVVDDENINAFATMGGFVYVNTGLLKLADNEAELASVIAHEIGHIASRHAVEQMRQTAIAGGVASAAGLNRNAAVQIGVDLALRRPNSRQDELEADQRGLKTLGGAGYAQSAMISFMGKLLDSPSVPSFLSTHPATSSRIAALKRAINSKNTNNVGKGLDSAAYKAQIRPLSNS